VNTRDNEGKTALHWAASVNNQEAAKALLDKKCGVNLLDSQVLCICFLLVGVVGCSQWSIQPWCCHHLEVIISDWQPKAVPFVCPPISVSTIFLYLWYGGNLARIFTVEIWCRWQELKLGSLHSNAAPYRLCRTGCQLYLVYCVVFQGRTPLFLATKEGNLDTAKILLQHQADKNIRDDQGRLPHDIALQRGNLEMVKELLSSKSISQQQRRQYPTSPTLSEVCVSVTASHWL
jgi:ankyrin repeat protein